MKIVESLTIKEKAYMKKLESGMTIIIIPKKNMHKKYIMWGTHFGSIDNHFIMPETEEEVYIPDGVAHFLEHKMFEQPNGTNSLDTLMALGIDANAYTTTDHTAYLFECTDNFYEGLDELMDYVQHPHFTEENVEKEKGIIGQEIMMYEDDPGSKLYFNAMRCLYHQNPVRIDIAGSIKSVNQIDKDVLYKCYHTFYHPSNMVMVACGDFEPEKLLEEIEKRLLPREKQAEIKRIYPEEPEKIAKEQEEEIMEVSMPIFMMGYKDIGKEKDKIRKQIALEILCNMIIGKSSDLYKELYEAGELLVEPDFDYEFTEEYAHLLISGQSPHPEIVKEKFLTKVEDIKQNGLDKKHFERIQKKIYGDYVTEYNSVADIARMFLADYLKGNNSFDYIEEFNTVTLEYVEQMAKEVFKKEQMIMSVVKGKK